MTILLTVLFVLPSVSGYAGEREIRWLPVRELRVDQVNPTLLMIDGEDTLETREEPRLAIAVRGVFPIQRQQELLRAATANTEEVTFLDYILERQALPKGTSSQTEPKWERVNVEVAEKVVRDTSRIDQIIFDKRVISPVFTMPLPARGDGRWGEKVKHPKLTKQDGQLLFRYLDVEPETHYRYRARLVVKNVFSDSQTKNPFLSRGATRKTPWSRPSPAILVRD